MTITIFDFDGVVTAGLHPTKGDLVVTGRCIDECDHVYKYLLDKVGFLVPVYFNPILYKDRTDKSVKSRTLSGNHKAMTLIDLLSNKVPISKVLEDDKIQFDIIKETLDRWPFGFDLKPELVFIEHGKPKLC